MKSTGFRVNLACCIFAVRETEKVGKSPPPRIRYLSHLKEKRGRRITILVSRWKHVRKLRSLCGSLRKTVLASLTVPLPRYTRAELRGTPRCGKILPSSYALCSPLIPATRLNIFRVDSLEYSQNEGDLWSRFITGCFNCTDLREIHKSINLNIT